MGLVADFQAAASDIFDGFGDAVFIATLTRTLPGTYDPETGQVTSTPQTSTCRVAFDAKPDTNDTRLAGLEILPTDEKLLIIEPTFAPRNGDTVTITARGDGTSVSGQPVRTIIFVDNVGQAGALYSTVGR